MASGLIYNEDGDDITMDALSEAVETQPGPTMLEMIKADVLAALREQASEALAHASEPTYNRYDCLTNSHWFETVADWLDDHWSEIVGEEKTP